MSDTDAAIEKALAPLVERIERLTKRLAGLEDLMSGETGDLVEQVAEAVCARLTRRLDR